MLKKRIFYLMFVSLLFITSLFMLELFSCFYLDENVRHLKTNEALHLLSNDFLKEKYNNEGCAFAETIIGHPTLGYVHRSRDFDNSSCKHRNYEINNINMMSHRDLPLVKNDEDFSVLIVGGSVAYLLSEFYKNSSIPYLEEYLNKNYYPPKKKKFKIYTGAAGGWAMPSQVNMLLMYQERIDGIISIDGYNETYSIHEGRRVEFVPASQYILSHYSKNDLMFKLINFVWKYRLLVENSLLQHSYFALVLYKIQVALLDQILVPQRLVAEFTEGNLENIKKQTDDASKWVGRSLYRYMVNFHKIAKAFNLLSAEFLQPTRLSGKKLTAEEAAVKEFIDPAAFKLIENNYFRMMKEKEYNVGILTDAFKDIKYRIYKDHIHYFHSGAGSPGNEIITALISQKLEKMWHLKKRK